MRPVRPGPVRNPDEADSTDVRSRGLILAKSVQCEPGMMASMNAVLIDPPAWFMARRRETGEDRWDEVWDGVVHMVPPPTFFHQHLASKLVTVLTPIAEARGWFASHETGLFDPERGEHDYRQPDVLLVDPAHVSERGVEGRAELVIEVLSPNDESRAKLPFYARHGVQEIWLVDPKTRAIEIYTLRGPTYFAVAAERDGSVRSPILGLELLTIAGPKLRVRAGDATTDC